MYGLKALEVRQADLISFGQRLAGSVSSIYAKLSYLPPAQAS